jgi:phage tail sheath protein FI
MARPQIIVNVTAALARRGAPTATGRGFLAYPSATGPAAPVVCLSEADALAAGVPATQAAWVGDMLRAGAPDVVVVKFAAVSPAAPTQAEVALGLGLFSSDYGPGQVIVPGVGTALVHAALLAHANTTKRTAILDFTNTATASSITTSLAALAASPGAFSTAAAVGWPKLPIVGGGTREVPGSVIMAGLAGRADARTGHAGGVGAGDQGVGAGFVDTATGVSIAYTDAELDSIHDAGGSVFRTIRGTTQLFGWKSISSDARFKQLNAGRMTMQLDSGIRAGAEAFLFRPIDGQGKLYAELEGFLRGYLQPLWSADALYGATADDAFDVDVQGVNNATTVQAGELKAAVEVALTPHTEKVTISVVTTIAEGA